MKIKFMSMKAVREGYCKVRFRRMFVFPYFVILIV